MKNLFAIAAVAAMLVACSGNTTSNTENAEAPACCQKDSTKACCQKDSCAAAADSTVAPADSAAVAE